MLLLWLACYVHSVLTLLIEEEAPENAVVILKNGSSGNKREVLLIDPSVLFSQPNEQNSDGPLDNTGLSDTSDIVTPILGNKIVTTSKHRLHDNPGLDSLDHLKKARIQSKHEIVHLSAAESPLIPGRSILRKEATESPPWLINGSGFNYLATFKKQAPGNKISQLLGSKSLKKQGRQVLKNGISRRWMYNDPGPSELFISHNQSILENSTANLPKLVLTKMPKQVQGKEMELDPLRRSSVDSGALNLLTSLKRSRRQAENETDELSELPHWPGMPQGILRKPYIKTSVLKRKILSMMLQSLYSAQERLWPLGPIVRKYEHLTPYRMAFIFMKLDQLVHEGHSIYMYLRRQTLNKAMTMTRRLQLYSQIMRRNVDVTYLVDYIMQRVPQDQVVRIRHWVIRHEQEEIMKKKTNWDKSLATRFIQRPDP